MGLLLALITYIGWGSGDIFGVFATRKIGAYKTTFFVFLFGFLAASFYLPFSLSDIHKITLGFLLLNIVFGTSVLTGNYLLNEAFRRSSASVVGILVQSFPAVVLVLSAIFFKDTITTKQIFWVILIFLGMFLCTINFSDFKKGKLIADQGIKYALIGSVIFSIYFTFLRVFINTYGWFWANYISIASFPLALILVKTLFHIKEPIVLPKQRIVLVATLISAVFLRGGDIALNLGISSGFTSIVTPIAAASPTLFIALASIIFKDPVSKQQKIGIGVSLLGIVLLSFFS